MAHIDEIIKRMGYAGSSCLKYGQNGFNGLSLSVHNIKVLDELDPYAVYIVDDEPFVLFYEETADQEQQKQIHRKIWNAQIPVTIVCRTGDVKIYSGFSIEREKSLLAEVGTVSAGQIDENSPFAYWEITSQSFWAKYAKQFSGEKLNERLLSNLSDITKKLRNEYHVSFATKLMLRLIFIRYLIDRGVDLDYNGFSDDVMKSRESLLRLLTDKFKLYALFAHLKDKFNGNLFDLDEDTNTSCLTSDVFRLLFDFLSANIDSKTGQLSFFDLYDFNIIPVGLISNIYEILLGKENRDRDNAFYTPQYLVNYILDDSISVFVRDHGTCKVLDPSCGSGIFLVESYRRMVEKELEKQPNGRLYVEDNTMLQNLLSDNIYGVDLNEDAIHVAIFSLYLAVLDYKNPKTLKKFALPDLKGKNLFVSDFFDEDALKQLETIPFDFIVGNPPWGKGFSLQKAYIKQYRYDDLMQNDDTCRAFILRSKDFCSMNTQCCFVLHSKMLYMQKGPSKKFREFLLKNTKISRVVELSSVRKLVFKNADAPAVILSYNFSDNSPLENRFEYISMKPNLFFRLFNIIVVEKTDVKYVRQNLLLNNDWAWKTLIYGLSGDIDAIIHLKSHISLRDFIDKTMPKLSCGVGIEDHPGDQKDASHLLTRTLLYSEAIDHFSINISTATTETFSKDRIHRPKKDGVQLFQAPYCLVKKGVDTTDFTMRSVFSEADFVYRATVYCIKGTGGQKPILLNLTGLFNSTLYAYLNLMIGSSLGVEREQRFMNEVLDFPFVFDQQIADQVELIQSMLAPQAFQVTPDADVEKDKLNKIILKAFQLEDNVFLDYALRVQIPQLTRSDDFAVHATTRQELTSYAQSFIDELSSVITLSGKYVIANIYPTVSRYYSAVEIVLQKHKPKTSIYVKEDLDSIVSALTKFSAHKINDEFFALKDVIHFEEDSFYIIKPNFYKNWHPAIAQLDLAEVIDQILSRDGGRD